MPIFKDWTQMRVNLFGHVANAKYYIGVIMRYLTTVFSCRAEKFIANWLPKEHYPFAIDIENNRLIAFNLSYAKMQEIVADFQIREFDIDVNPSSRSPHYALYRHVDSAIGGNAMVAAEYYRRKYHGQKVRVPSRHELVYNAFFEKDYPDAEDARNRICFDLYGINACHPTEVVEADNLPDITAPLPAKRNGIIRNTLILTFREMPELKPDHSCLGAEAWDADIKLKTIIAVNLPILLIEHIISCAHPTTLHYYEEAPEKEYCSLSQFMSEELTRIRHKQPVITDAPRLPYRENLQGIDTSNFDN